MSTEPTGPHMRSDTIKRGDARAAHRSLLRATGVGEGDWDKPFIAICNSHVDIIPGHVHLQAVGNYVKECVRAAGGVPFLFNTIGVDDGIAMGHNGMKFSLPSRELIADCVETMIEAHRFDGMICIPNCDKIVPGMFMGAMRVNIPTVFVSGGPMEAGKTASGKTVDLIDAFVAGVQRQNGKITAEELDEIEKAACPTCGSCSGMFTANSMNCLAEALGMALPGNGTILATSADRKALYDRAARRIVAMAREFGKLGPGHGLLPREIATAVGLRQRDDPRHGDGRQHQHRPAHPGNRPRGGRAVHDEADRRAEPERPRTSARFRPRSPYHIEDVARAGGIHTILGEVERGRPGLLDLTCPTVTGKTLGENIAAYDVRAATAAATARLLDPRPPGRRTDQPGLDRAERRRRGALPGRRPDLLEAEGEDPASAGNRRGSGGDGFDPFDVIRDGRQRLFANRRPDACFTAISPPTARS